MRQGGTTVVTAEHMHPWITSRRAPGRVTLSPR
jgi:hypothetical protein